jgi:hypothetical protein
VVITVVITVVTLIAAATAIAAGIIGPATALERLRLVLH